MSKEEPLACKGGGVLLFSCFFGYFFRNLQLIIEYNNEYLLSYFLGNSKLTIND